uniref:DUF4794 domain-containing protein n=1 Tax=Glossina brevipalpis TaxID=37001 RepID=A0A1A9WFI7_9MUSC
MKIFFGLWFMTMAMAGSLITAIPLNAVNRKLSRQMEFSTSSSLTSEQTGYPEAGFRPRIPFELPNQRKSKEVIENIDDVTRSTTSITEDAVINMPATVYGLPEELDDVLIIDAEVIPIPAEDFQPPHAKSVQDFTSSTDNDNSLDTDAIADLPATQQTTSTKTENRNTKQDPLIIYGAPELNLNFPKSDVETVSVEQIDGNNFEGPSLQQQSSDEARQIPAETYGVPELSDLDTGLKVDLTEAGIQFEILKPTTGRSARLIILPLPRSSYLGRLKTQDYQRANGRLLKL